MDDAIRTPILNLSYQFPDQSFCLPWTRPDMDRLKLWYRDMVNDWKEIENEFQFVLFGRFWSNQAKKTWQAEVYLVPRYELWFEVEGGDEKHQLELAAAIVKDGYRKALNEHRLGIRIGLTTSNRLNVIHSRVLEVELGNADSISTDGLDVVYAIPHAVSYFSDGSWSIISQHAETRQMDKLAPGKLVVSDEPWADEMLKSIVSTNAIYFKPVGLQELFAPISSLVQEAR